MAIDFKVKDIMHQIAVKFTHAFLPEAKKPYYAKAALQTVLDIHGIASKADVYNIATSPKTIEEGLTAGIELMFYLAADGYRLKTPMFNLNIRVPGEYDGSETRLADGTFPRARLQTSAGFRKYLEKNITVVFDGRDENEGHIGEVRDEATGLIDEVMTRKNILTIHGFGLKIESDENNQSTVGLFFESDHPRSPVIKADVIAVNEPRTLKVVIPEALAETLPYTLKIVTQSSAKHSGTMLKTPREIRSDFTLTAQD
jgi:hypothetical protein